MCCPLVFEFSVGIGGFVIGLGQISFFFSSYWIVQLFGIGRRKASYAVYAFKNLAALCASDRSRRVGSKIEKVLMGIRGE